MTAAGVPSSERGSRFPIPLVGTAVILALLIVLTPVLINAGAGAGGLLAQADLVVDHPPQSPTTSFYVEGVGVVRYAVIDIGLNEDYQGGSWQQIVWNRWTNATDQVLLNVSTNAARVAVNVSVEYIATPGAAGDWYYGILASVYSSSGGTITLSAILGVSAPSGPISVNSGHTLPLAIPLFYYGPGGPPL